MLPMILVQTQIRKMLGRETGKTTNLGLRVEDFHFVYNKFVRCAGVDCEIIGIGFMTVFIRCRDLACFQHGLQLYCHFVLLGTAHSVPLSAYI
jgi:hypothetical protein